MEEMIARRAALSPEEQRLLERIEDQEWLESLEYVLESAGPERTRALLELLERHALRHGVALPFVGNTPLTNTIPAEQEMPYPGDLELEARIRNLIRWNAVAMVVRANKHSDGIGGHLATYASAAELFEVGFNHFFRGREKGFDRDLVYIQGHASPGIYARAFLEGRLSEAQLRNFRRELKPEGGLASYPHPWLMPEFWEYPTVSMGLGPIMSIYQARFMRYLEHRGLKPKSSAKVWAFIGDGETDEPEILGALRVAARERLDNLIWVVNCNLQRLDGPVYGNGQVVQELERIFRGAGWNVIKVAWGRRWDALLARDTEGRLLKRFAETVDGWWQKYVAEGPRFFREHFFGADPKLAELVQDLSDADLEALLRDRGGHDPTKVYAAYRAAVEHRGQPTVILAHTIKGYGLGAVAEARNVAHQVKKLDTSALREFRDRLQIPVPDEALEEVPFYRPDPDSPEIRYLRERRAALGGFVPKREVKAEPLPVPEEAFFEEFYKGTGGRPVSTTMALVRIIAKLLRHKELGRRVVPIIPDEGRTFGMEALVAQVGIYSPVGQRYEPPDAGSLLVYKEAQDGQILEEGITEAGAMSSFIAAGTAHTNYGIPMIPFYIYYSMFGFQRVGDLIWAAGDSRARGFLIGATAGRTTLAGEGLQHQDGHSHVAALTVPNLVAYDPAFAYEIAVIIQDGLRRMYHEGEDVFYYITVGNENYAQPEMPEPRETVKEGILKGLYKLRASNLADAKHRAQLFGSGAILNEVLKAQELLEAYGVAADVWSVTSYKNLYRDAVETDRWNRLHPTEAPRLPYAAQVLKDAPGVFVAASDYMKLLPDALSGYLPKRMHALGTDGFGRSEARAELRDHFEVDARHITVATLAALAREGELDPKVVEQAIQKLGVDPEKPDPVKL